MVSYANGFVPASALAVLDGQPGWFLRADAAAAWNAARAEVKRRTGIVLTVRGSNRTYAEQVTFYLQRHRLAQAGERVCCYWQARPYKFTGTAHAAPPGTSNHGWGLAVDVVDFGNVGNFSHPRRVAAFPILAQYGWTDTEGRGAIREPWHLVWNPSSAWAVNNPIGAGGSVSIPSIPGAPTPIEEEDMTPDQANQLKATLEHSQESRRMLGVILGYNPPANATEAAALDKLHAAGEARRMLGVLLGHNAPVDSEKGALARVWGATDEATEARRMLGVILGWQAAQGPEGAALSKLQNPTTPTTKGWHV